MDFPAVEGIAVEQAFKDGNVEGQRRLECVENLTQWGNVCGFRSRDTVKFVIGEDGLVKCRATHFIPAGKHLMHVPFSLDLSFAALKSEIPVSNGWHGWRDLKARVKMFAKAFRWHPYNVDQKDNFSKNLLLVMTIIAILKKLNTNSSLPTPEEESHILKTFSLYWHSLPARVGSILLDWTEAELKVVQNSSFFNCLSDAKRFGVELFQLVVVPFIAQYPEIFGETIDFETFMRINCMVCSRSFNAAPNKSRFFDCKLIPIVDLLNGKTNDQHNCVLENCAIQKDINGEFLKFHAVEVVHDISAGEEIFLEYPQVGNGQFLLSYDVIPMDPGVIMNNQKTDVFIDFGEFLDAELLRMHANAPTVRKMKKEHIYGFFNLPRIIGVSMDDLFSAEYTCIPAIRQVLIFLLCNEEDAGRAIASSKIKSQFEPPHVFLLFGRFIEVSLGKPDLVKFRSLVTSVVDVTEKTDEKAEKAEDEDTVEKAVKKAVEEAREVSERLAAKKAERLAVKDDPVKASVKKAIEEANQAAEQAQKVSERLAAKAAAAEKESALGPTTKLAPALKPKKASATPPAKGPADKEAESAIGPAARNILPVSGTAAAAYAAYLALSPNTRSAVFLHMSERLVIEVMVNRFINLFPENFHEIGYSILSAHLVSTEINTILEQLCRPANLARASTCMICGAGGPISKCSRCKSAYYCSPACQKEHWTYHKRTCGKS